MVPYAPECVDIEYSIDSARVVRLIRLWSKFRSELADIGCHKCSYGRKRRLSQALMIIHDSMTVRAKFPRLLRTNYFREM